MARGNFGELLKRERELREVTLEEITSATRIGPHFLEALENEDWDKLPGGVFNRGFVRAVARYLGLDEEGLLSEYDLAHGSQVSPPPGRPENRIPSPPRWLPVALVLAVLVVLLGLSAAAIYGWRYIRSRRTHVASSDSTSPPSSPMPGTAYPGPSISTVPSSSSASAPRELPLKLAVSPSASTHLRVFSDGNLVFDNDIRPGENLHFSASSEFEITAADSGAVLLELNGQAVPPLGVPGSSGTMKLSRNDLR
jgi:cytoskeleton protein RodZ